MRTTVTINDQLLQRAKVHAAASNRTLSEVVEDGLRLAMTRAEERPVLDPLPVFGALGVRPGVDVSRNASLRDQLDEDVPFDAMR